MERTITKYKNPSLLRRKIRAQLYMIETDGQVYEYSRNLAASLALCRFILRKERCAWNTIHDIGFPSKRCSASALRSNLGDKVYGTLTQRFSAHVRCLNTNFFALLLEKDDSCKLTIDLLQMEEETQYA